MSSWQNKRICILGAGVIGLSTACRLLELSNSKLDITIVAEAFDESTTSDGAGGLFRPDDRFMIGCDKNLVREWCTNSFDYYHRLLSSVDGGKAGVFQASGYQLFNDNRTDPSYKDIVYEFRHLRKHELNMFQDKYNHGYFCTTICIDVRAYMKYLTELLVLGGVKFVKKKVDNLNAFLDQTQMDIVFNCVGYGASTCCDDKKIVPIRGQMIRVKAPWIKHFYYTGDDCYIIPNMDTVCLGGTRQIDDNRLTNDPIDSLGILNRCQRLCPSLTRANIEWEWTGLRPHREPIRVEMELHTRPTGESVRVIHNYGHGGNGISLSRGTVVYAVGLLTELNKSKL